MLFCSISLHQAFGAGGPQRRKVPTSARLAVLRNRFLRSQEVQQEEYLSHEHVREGRNLASVFPFVGGNRALPRARLFGEEPDHHDHHEHHDEHHEHHDEHRNFDPRISRQRNGDGYSISCVSCPSFSFQLLVIIINLIRGYSSLGLFDQRSHRLDVFYIYFKSFLDVYQNLVKNADFQSFLKLSRNFQP